MQTSALCSTRISSVLMQCFATNCRKIRPLGAGRSVARTAEVVYLELDDVLAIACEILGLEAAAVVPRHCLGILGAVPGVAHLHKEPTTVVIG